MSFLILRRLAMTGICFALISCALPPAVENQYQLTQYRYATLSKHEKQIPSLYISMPEAVVGFQTEQMLYTKTPLTIEAYVHNTWNSPPADMLYPLIIQSFQKTHAFKVVSAGSHAENYRYRLDTQILHFVQNFQKKPSRMEITIKATITNSITGSMIASRIFQYAVPCPKDSPSGGAAAANRITQQFTYELTQFVMREVKIRTYKKLSKVYENQGKRAYEKRQDQGKNSKTFRSLLGRK